MAQESLREVRFVLVMGRRQREAGPKSARRGHGGSSAKTFNVGARHGGIASRSGRDTDCVNFVGHSAVGAFPHVHYHRGYRLAYSASPEKRERALLALLNVLFSRHCR
jgi:hypothetical protein